MAYIWESNTSHSSFTVTDKTISQSGSSYSFSRSNIPIRKGKIYWEMEVISSTNTACGVGVVDSSLDYTKAYGSSMSNVSSNFKMYFRTGVLYKPTLSGNAAYGAGDVIGLLFNLEKGELQFTKNGVLQNNKLSNLNTNLTYYPMVFSHTNIKVRALTNKREFKYTIPEGYEPLEEQLLKYFLKNKTTNKVYSIVNDELIEMSDVSELSFEEYGIDAEYEFDTVNVDNFENLIGLPFEVLGYSKTEDIPRVGIKFIHSERKLATSPDVLILGVEIIKDIVATYTNNPLTAISFNNGLTWLSYENGNWITVENAHQGMSTDVLNSITESELNFIRGDSNYIKFQHSVGNDDRINSFKMYVDFAGVNGILDTAYYSFDYSGGQLEVTLKKQGNYSIVYTDVDV